MTPALLPRIRAQLTLHTRRRVSGLLEGGRSSVFHGRSLDFDDLREYVPGDEIRDIDWKATARHTAPLVKRYAEHRRLRLGLVVASGATMDALSAGGESKRDLAILLAGIAGWFAVRGGDEVCLATGDGHRTRLSRPESSEAGLEHLLRRILSQRGTADAQTVLDHLAWLSTRLRRRHLLVVVSDEIDLDEDCLRLLRRLTAHHELLWLTVAEADPLALAAEGGTPYDAVAALQAAGGNGVRVPAGAHVPAGLTPDARLREEFARAEEQRRARTHRVLRAAGAVHETVGRTAEAVPAFHRLAERHRRVR
ncbi:DUF58 domain-containing protein [Brevibacterium album]|uniref:DUF58 domain-containing protein n=1 Tax=Brevibacterium album TaxID=417948 RepID=UPI0003F865D8|nr:DUF58 domain-containing protein [Brevibacterium album]